MIKILVVDDSEDVLFTLRDQLECFDFEVRVARNVEEAFLIYRGDPDIVALLTDGRIPQAGAGSALAARLKDAGFQGLTILISGAAWEESRAYPFDAVFDKPLSRKDYRLLLHLLQSLR